MHVKKSDIRYQNLFSEIQNSDQEVQFLDWHIGVHRKALILNANVFNHCIRYKIPSGPVNIVGSFKYLVHLYFQYMSAAKLHQSCRTCHIIFNVEYLKSVKNVGL